MLAGSVFVSIAIMMSASMMPAQAVSLTIDDPSFEGADLAPGAFTNNGPDDDWDISNGAGFFDDNGSLSPQAIDGTDIAYSAGGTICQVLGDTITGDTNYILPVWVGSRTGGFNTFPGYDIELLSDDDTLLASLDETTGNPPVKGFWALNILTHTVFAGDPSIGKFLKICLSSVGQQTNFDDVSLDATLISIPIGGTSFPVSTTTLLVAGVQANMGLWSLALVGIVGAGVAITYKLKSKKTEQ